MLACLVMCELVVSYTILVTIVHVCSLNANLTGIFIFSKLSGSMVSCVQISIFIFYIFMFLYFCPNFLSLGLLHTMCITRF